MKDIADRMANELTARKWYMPFNEAEDIEAALRLVLAPLAYHIAALEAVDFGSGKDWTPAADVAANYLRDLRAKIQGAK